MNIWKGRSRSLTPASIEDSSPTPSENLGAILERLGTNLYSPTPVQHVAWAVQIELFEVIEQSGIMSISDVCAQTPLNENGADALLGVLSTLGLLNHLPDNRYCLTQSAREYFLGDSPYFIGRQLGARNVFPSTYLKTSHRPWNLAQTKARSLFPLFRFGSWRRLRNQHARNLPACTVAARGGEFSGAKCIVDLAGGSGAFAIPLALRYPGIRVVLTDLPHAVKKVRRILVDHGLENRIELVGMDALQRPWKIPPCDGIFVGNFLHAFDDHASRLICTEAFQRITPGGRLWIHEMLWNQDKKGPMLTALTNATTRRISGRQRSATEFMTILRDSGFTNPYVIPTASPFSLIVGRR